MKVLVVDDQEDNRALLCEILEDADYDVIEAEDGKAAIEKAKQESPGVILLDIHMPVMDGYEACKILKEQPETVSIPVIFLTANTAEESVVKGLELGAYDYVTKPFNEKELLARIKVMTRIRESEKEAEEKALTDPLTGLYNRRYLMNRFKEEINRATRDNNPLSCFMVDIDFFKKVNDTYGHDAGDAVLKNIANILKTNLRDYDSAVRYGGEEFVVLLPNTSRASAVAVAEKIRIVTEEAVTVISDYEIKVTLSIGVYGREQKFDSLEGEAYITCADNALYLAKNRGRNKVILFSE